MIAPNLERAGFVRLLLLQVDNSASQSLLLSYFLSQWDEGENGGEGKVELTHVFHYMILLN